MCRRLTWRRLTALLAALLLGLFAGVALQRFYPVGTTLRRIGILSVTPTPTRTSLGTRLTITAAPSPVTTDPSTSPLKMLVVGNSIALHDPAPGIGWCGSWGMAASSPERDFAHLILSYASIYAPRQLEMRIQNLVDFERDFVGFELESLRDYQAYQADLIILRLGDNVLPDRAGTEGFAARYAALVAYLNPEGRAHVVASGSWYPNSAVDEQVRLACGDERCTYVDLSMLYSDLSNHASAERPFTNEGVGSHPGDKGMRAIADLLWQEIQPWLSQGSP